MGIVNKLVDFKRTLATKNVDVAVLDPLSRRGLSTGKLPQYPVWFFAPSRGIPRQEDLRELRQFAKSGWVQQVTNAIKKAVLQTVRDVVVDADVEAGEEVYKEQVNYVKHFLENPSREPHHDFDFLLSNLLDDILHIDAGVLFLNGPAEGNLVEILPYDASSFLKEIDVKGFLINYWQYSWRHPMNQPMEFEPEQIAYFQMNRRPSSPYGYSPLQAIQQVVELLNSATKFNKDFFLNNAIPSILINLQGHKDGIKRFKNEWLDSLEGENARITVTNAPEIKVEKLASTNRDMEWLAGQKWYMHLVFASYGLSPSEVGFTDTVGSKSVQEGQERITIRNAHLPYLNLIEKMFNRLIIPRILGEATMNPLERSPIKLKFFPKDPQMESMETEGQRADIASKILTINEVRKLRGLEPLKGEQADDPFNDPFLEPGGIPFENDKEAKGKEDAQKGKPEQGGPGGGSKDEERVKRSTPSTPFDASTRPSELPLKKTAEPITIDASGSYDEFFDDLVKEWSRQITGAIEKRLYKVPRTRNSEDAFLKDFGDFLSVLIRGITITPFLNLLRGVVKNTMFKGVEEAEKELSLNIKVSEQFHRSIDARAQEQFNGYTMPTGKKWVGLRGLSKALQQKVYDRVRKGFENREMTDTIVDDIHKMLKGLRRSRAATIVRSESTRLVNEGKLHAYKDSGVDGRKEYVAFIDNRTTDLCKSLNGQRRELSENFDGPAGESIAIPPAHANCRSFIRFVRE